MKVIQIGYTLLLGASVTVGLGCGKSSGKAAPAAAKASPIKTVKVELQRLSQTLDLPARVEADPANVVHVYPPAGGRLLAMSVRPGDHVRKGQTIAIEQSADVAQSRADYERAHSEWEKSRRALDRAKLLFDHKVLSEREYEQAQADAEEAKSELDRATSRLQILGVAVNGNSNEVALVAPRGGAVLEVGAAAGELSKSTDNANSIATIADLSTIWVVGDVYEKDLGALKQGDAVDVTVAAYPDQKWQGKIAVISDALDQQTRTLKVRVVLSNPGEKLKPEMFATIRARKPAKDMIAIPASAVVREGGDTTVMLQTKPDMYERRLITIASTQGDQVMVSNGLNAGDVIVFEGAALVRGGGEQE